ncbi:MAG: endolytic transglycosylase MltG [Oscillospiraceae bacterium]|nr:endolytic transglycosylase MltG [Oscillospiraceae bacterium]
MADENKPLDGSAQEAAETAEAAAEALTETAEAAEQSADAAADAAEEAAAEVEAIVQEALGKPEGEAAPAAEEASAETPAQPKKPAARKNSAKKSGLAGMLPKKKKKRTRKRTIEDELADLAAEEAEFDSWGRPIKKKKKRRRRKTRKLSCTLVLLTLILALSSVLSVLILAVAKEMYGIDKDYNKKIVMIEEGAGTRAIAEQLQKEGIITLPQVFRLVSRMNGMDGKYIAGEHHLTPSMSYETMIDELCTNYQEEGREPVRVTIPEGYTLLQAAQVLEEHEVCTAESFLFFFNSGQNGMFKFEQYLPEKSSLKFQQMEGYCFPDTYEFYVNEDPNIVAQKIYANFNSKMTDADYKKMNELGWDLDKVITLASIIEAESGGSSKYMKHVSSVFHNRLLHSAEFPKLQSDPTRKYAEDVIAPNLERDNPTMRMAYNTYEGAGLPPGAICNPGRAAIEAALYPDQTNDFYFNANIDTGETYFAETYEQHKQNLALVNAQYAAAEAAANGENANAGGDE